MERFIEHSNIIETPIINDLLGVDNTINYSFRDIFTTIFPKEIVINKTRGDFMLTHQDIGYFNIGNDGKINLVCVYLFKPNDTIWDGVINLLRMMKNK